MKRFFVKTFLRRSVGAGLGATASVLLAGCVVDQRSPEVCDPSAVLRADKCPPLPSATGDNGGTRGSDY